MENRAAEIHDGLKHPVIDGDGHWLEPIPVFLEYLREVGGAEVCRSDARAVAREGTPGIGRHQRSDSNNRLRRAIWWGVTSNTRDKATALLPDLLNERLPELGIDFALIYPSFGLTHQRHTAGRPAPRRGPRLQHDDGRHVRAVRRAIRARGDHSLLRRRTKRSRSWNTRSDSGVQERSCCAEIRSGRFRARRRESTVRRPPGIATPSPSTAPMTTSRSGNAASILAWP